MRAHIGRQAVGRHTCTHTRMYSHTHVLTHSHTHTHTHTQAHMYVCTQSTYYTIMSNITQKSLTYEILV